MHGAFTSLFNPGNGALTVMVADMQRLENAARLAMGDFDGPSVLPPQRHWRLHALMRPAPLLLVLAAAGLLTAAFF